MTFTKPALVLSFSALLVACGQAPTANAPAANNTTTAASTPERVTTPPPYVTAEGRNIYMDNCAGCHKEDGRGGKIEIEGTSIDPDDLTAAKIKAFSDEKIYGYIHRGIEDEGMPAFKDKLSEAEIREVVRYVRAEIQKMPPTQETKRP